MFGGEQETARKVRQLVEEWIPSKAYSHESKFQEELQRYLDERLNESNGMGPLGGNQSYVVSRERGNARADVVVDDIVGIELKRAFSNNQKKKLRGQLEEYADEYPFVIACACGISDMDGWRDLEQKYTNQMGGFGMDTTEFAFIIKREEEFGREPNSGGGGLFGGDSLF